MKGILLAAACLGALGAAAVPAVDLSDDAQRAAQPKFEQVSHSCGVQDGDWADGRWCYRYQVTKPWIGGLPEWPSVNLKPAVSDWSAYDRLVLDVYNASTGGDVLNVYLSEPTGRLQNGLLASPGLSLNDYGFHRWTIPLKGRWPKTVDPRNIGRLHLFMTTPTSADIRVSGFHLLKPGEQPPPVSETFMAQVVRPGEIRAEQLRKERRRNSVERFVARCRAAGQSGRNAWIGQATSMQKVRPRDAFDVAAAARFELALARGEYESLQVLVMPNGRDLKGVTVEPAGLRCGDVELPAAAFKCSPMGYVKTVNPPPYKGGVNVATNLPGGYFRKVASLPTGWWPDPILDYLDKADVAGDDVQSFWLRLKCPRGQKPGTYAGTLRVKGADWSEEFPFAVRVYDFEMPVKSPLPLAITFAPEPHLQFATPEDTALAKRLRADPKSPLNVWRRHETAWGDFLADHFITMDSLYLSQAAGIHWDVLLRLKEQGRLGLFNLGYWSYPGKLDDAAKDAWRKGALARLDVAYGKAKELGLLDHAYLYGCDEISPKYFPNIKFALAELRKRYPGVPLFTTAYDHDFGVGTDLAQMDWFTPTTVKFAENFAKIGPSRAAGHQVWWYIACGPHAPYANMFVEYQGIEPRMLMGAQTVKWRPEGFLYYQMTIWNSERPISGPSTFTDWEPRSWTRYHGDGSWFCCGPDGAPCETIRMENFRDGLEDYAYALEYERRTGKTCEVPPEVCRAINQFTDDPQAYYAWRNRLAEEIERAAAR